LPAKPNSGFTNFKLLGQCCRSRRL
jgi:hypothetical protein